MGSHTHIRTQTSSSLHANSTSSRTYTHEEARSHIADTPALRCHTCNISHYNTKVCNFLVNTKTLTIIFQERAQ